MKGETYSNLNVGDPCWVILDNANSPSGYLRGKVVEVEERDGYNSVKAVITDPRQDPQSPIGRRSDLSFGTEPFIHYSVIPSNREFDGLVKRIIRLEVTRERGISCTDKRGCP